MKSLLRLPEVIARTGLPRTTLYELIKASDFPKPIRLTMRSVAWPSDDINSWIEDRVINGQKNHKNKSVR